MRYENWDVLLFPGSSKVPIQEFKTQCFVTRDRDSPYLQNPSIVSPSSYYPMQGNFGHLPVLTTFVPSLQEDAPFRVSIHSWEKPRPSRLMESLMQPDDILLYEARVFIDGLCCAGSIFGQRTTWPHVIDLSSHIDRNGNQDCLRFPSFHQDILDQRHWDAGDLHGRIRVVIAEGFARPNRSPPFERVKDVIALSFQHAPLHVLEYSKIAWPNAAMWSQAPSSVFKYNSGSTYSDFKEPEEAHAHSPSKPQRVSASSHSSSQPMMYNHWASREFPVMPQWQPTYSREPRWIAYNEPFMTELGIDPYISDPAWRHRGARSSREDVPMPDYVGSSSSSSRAISSMAGVSYEHSKQPSIAAPMDDDQYHQLILALSPTKTPTTGAHAPSNTPSVAVPMGTKLSAAAEARSASYTRTSARASVLREISQPSTRDVSGSSMKSNLPAESAAELGTPSKAHASPSGNVEGKKEGTENKENKESEGNENTLETPRRETCKTCTPPSKKGRRTSGSVEILSETKTKSARDGLHASRLETVDISPSKTSFRVVSSKQGVLDDFLEAGTENSVITDID